MKLLFGQVELPPKKTTVGHIYIKDELPWKKKEKKDVDRIRSKNQNKRTKKTS